MIKSSSFFVIAIAITITLFFGLSSSTSTTVQGAAAISPSQPFRPNIAGLQRYNLTADVSSFIAPWNQVFTWGQFFGAYPEIIPQTGEYCNGGIPQLANLTEHAIRMNRFMNLEIQRSAISPDFSSMIIIDYESWHFTWNLTNDVYKNASMEYVRQQYPDKANDQTFVENTAILQYTTAVRNFLNTTFSTIRATFPKSKIGCYGYGGVFGYWIRVPQRQQLNDVELGYFWPMIDVLAPSLYLPYKSGKSESFLRNKLYLSQNLEEANRLKQKFSSFSSSSLNSLIIAPYCWHRYHPGEPSGGEFLTPQDLELEYNYPMTNKVAKSDFVIMWGDETQNTSNEQQTFQLFVKNKSVFELKSLDSSSSSSSKKMLMKGLNNNMKNTEDLTMMMQNNDILSFLKSQNNVTMPPYKLCSL